MIYISTGGYGGRPADSVAAELHAAGADAIELSAGLYSPSLLADLKALTPDIRFQVHNYFPPPAEPFVLNLGSLNADIGARSMAHVAQALEWCVELGADRYSFHAGFLLDPHVGELGQRIPGRRLFERDACVATFIERVTELEPLAARAGVRLMIENNVLSATNASEFTTNPLLMCEPAECRDVMAQLPASVGLLIDVAHLKVSANSLDFDAAAMFSLCNERIAGYHLSDNDGLVDSNKPFAGDAWFWPHLKADIDYCSVEVYGRPAAELVRQVELVEAKLRSARGTP